MTNIYFYIETVRDREREREKEREGGRGRERKREGEGERELKLTKLYKSTNIRHNFHNLLLFPSKNKIKNTC